MNSKIEFVNVNTTLSDHAGLTFSEDTAKTVIIKSANITVSAFSMFSLTPALINLHSFELSVSNNSHGLIVASDDIELQPGCQAKFTISTADERDLTDIDIGNLDFLSDDYSNVKKLAFNFDTHRAPNFGRFIFRGNGSEKACKKLFDLGFVYVNDEPATFDLDRFSAVYSNSKLTLSLKKGR
jgi:hypothetical protein